MVVPAVPCESERRPYELSLKTSHGDSLRRLLPDWLDPCRGFSKERFLLTVPVLFDQEAKIWFRSPALSLRASKPSLVPASMPVGVNNAPSPEAGNGVTLPLKDNAITLPSPGRRLSALVV